MHNPPPSRRRKLRTWTPGSGSAELKPAHGLAGGNGSPALLDLASNDYLGLSRHPALIEAARTSLFRDGVGAGGSRLITGSRPVHASLEQALAHWLGRDKVLLFPSGFQANLAAVIALADRSTPVLADRLTHHSLLVGIKASGAKLQRFNHLDLNDLKQRLKRCRMRNPDQSPLVITESLFSMEGTSPGMQALAELCEHHKARLLVDEAHALGVLGPEGRGLCHGLETPVALISGTFGKAFGSGGAFLAGDALMADRLLQGSGAFRYTTALAPPLAAAALAALQLIEANPDWGVQLLQHAQQWREALANAGWQRPAGHGQILSVLIGSDQLALDHQHQLEAAGLLSVAIRPPTVPDGTARLRLVLHRNLPDDTLGRLVNALGPG
ncbi:MAG: aminotransferase class I/II-fold pyridoxal phosphate-dependent enzyme [Prochlorococcus sp.]